MKTKHVRPHSSHRTAVRPGDIIEFRNQLGTTRGTVYRVVDNGRRAFIGSLEIVVDLPETVTCVGYDPAPLEVRA